MANFSISLSQSAIDTINSLRTQYGKSTVAESIDVFFKAAYNFSASHPYYSSYSASGSSARFNFSDGSYRLITGGTAAGGFATSTSEELYFSGLYRLDYGGTLHYTYTTNSSGGLAGYQTTDATINVLALQTLLPTYSSSYSQTYGNQSSTLNGVMNFPYVSNNFNGTINSFAGHADKFINSENITGSFNISGNPISIGQNLGTTTISGILKSYTEQFYDGSHVSIDTAAMAVTGSTTIDETVLANPLNFGGSDVINITLPAVLRSAWAIASGAGNDSITIQGGGNLLSVNAGEGNDTIALKDSNHGVDGGAGIDLIAHVATPGKASMTPKW